MTTLKQAILHSLLQKESLCCLCFGTVGSEHVYLDDEAMVNDSGNVKLAEVLYYILGYDVMNNLAFQTLCDDCVVSAIQSYMFIKRCKENTENLQQAIENLDISLQNLRSNQESCKTMFLSLDSSLDAQVYYDYKNPVTSLPKALVRFKYVSSDVCNGKYYIERSVQKESKTWIVPTVGDDDDFDSDWCMSPGKRNNTKKGHRGKEILSDSVMLHENSTNKRLICNGCEKTFESITMLRLHYMRVHAVKKLQCPKCDHKFATSKLLEYHLSLSHVDAICFECGKTFTNIASLKKHELSHNISSKYICQNCHRVYKTLRTMKDHIYNGVCERGGRTGKSVNGILAFDTVCKECAITALNSYTFIKKCKENAQNLHKAITNLDNSIQHDVEHVYCKSLFISFNEDLTTRDFFDYKRPVNSPSAILKRFQSVSNIGNYKNDVQDVKNDDLDYFELDTEPVIKHKKHKSKPRKNTLPKELILHKDSTHLSYKCSGCLKIFQTLDYLRQHYLRLHAPKTFKCPKCERSYASYKLVEQHLKDCHQTVICVECGKTYKNRFSLKQHELSHRLRFVCQSCGRVYKNKDTFKQHIEYGICGQSARKSATDGLFKCDICNKQYSRKNTLRVHIQFEHTNTGQQHVCSWCNKKFSCQSRLKAHTVKHTQEKNFPCDICGGKFVTKESLLYHTRIHTGEKPYKCSFCDLRFLSSSRRAEHVRRQHMDPTLTCDICKAKFRSHSCLLKHKQRHANPNSRLFAVEGKPQAEENDYCFKN
ncbi:zinc finger protein 91-like isoform X1 [Cydia strobilella]|uniref:zinc finger protein 91-like isoform X1 n=1 Tax=Cydia strobilella TaxID=1100964 RepID=UPI0030054BFD